MFEAICYMVIGVIFAKAWEKPKKEWVGLTDEEYLEIKDEYSNEFGLEAKLADDFAKAIESKLKEKNT